MVLGTIRVIYSVPFVPGSPYLTKVNLVAAEKTMSLYFTNNLT